MKMQKSLLTLVMLLTIAGCGQKGLDINLDSLDVKPVEKAETGNEYLLSTDTESADYEEDTWTDEGTAEDDYGSRVADLELLENDYDTEEVIDIPVNSEESSTEKNTEIKMVVFGNSVTCNEISDLWKGTWGMAATEADTDYVHLLKKWLTSEGYTVQLNIVSIKDWELAKDRKTQADDLLKNVDKDMDVILLQTGENITEYKDTLNQDYLDLLSRLKEKASEANIAVLAELLWPKEDIETAKKGACQNAGIPFLSMDDFLSGYESTYKSSLGATVQTQDGGNFSIDNEVVAAHPNDEGMKKIAEIVKEYLKGSMLK